MKVLISDVYKTYEGDGEPHKLRLLITFFVCAVVSLVGGDFSEATFPAMALTVSVLAGFTFTALFSGHLLTTNELPEPRDENDRKDISILKRLAVNFRARSRFFLVISIFILVIIILLSVPLDTEIRRMILVFLSDILPNHSASIVDKISKIFAIFRSALVFTAFFTFFECLYTFYRLSETALAITDTRRDYIDARK